MDGYGGHPTGVPADFGEKDNIAHGRYLTNAELDEAKTMVANFKPLDIDRAANEVDLKDIKWDRVAPAANEADAAKTKKL